MYLKHIVRIVNLMLITLTVTVVSGCANLLDETVESVTPHEARPFVKPEVEQISVTGFDEFKDTLIKLIMIHETEAQILYHNYDGENVQAEVERASIEIMEHYPIGAYAVSNIIVNATRLVSYFEVDVVIEFSRSPEQIDSIVSIATERHLMAQLLIRISEYNEVAVIRTGMQMTEEEIAELVRVIYYQNPRRIIMLPFVTVETFPEEGNDRIYEIKFGYIESPSMMRLYGATLAEYVRENAVRVVRDSTGETLLTLAEYLIATTAYDEATAVTIFEHGARHFAATAFGALVRGSAVGEGFAMAFKALCDELEINSRVVLGVLDGKVHAWNIVYLDGDYYHIDVAMSVLNGLETAFLKTDADFEELGYIWDMENTVRCEGGLTLEDIKGPEEEPEDPEDPENPENPQDTANGTDEGEEINNE